MRREVLEFDGRKPEIRHSQRKTAQTRAAAERSFHRRPPTTSSASHGNPPARAAVKMDPKMSNHGSAASA